MTIFVKFSNIRESAIDLSTLLFAKTDSGIDSFQRRLQTWPDRKCFFSAWILLVECGMEAILQWVFAFILFWKGLVEVEVEVEVLRNFYGKV